MDDLTAILYPPIDAYAAGALDVGPPHRLYWEQSGAPDGVPLVFLHGGPGGAGGPDIRRFFDPQFFRIIYFHQRGAGRSTPLGEVSANTTWDLVEDIERLRAYLGVDRWVVAGGSWGSTLALAYAQQHPEACLALLLNGVFLGRRSDLRWFLDASKGFFPEAWDAFAGFLPVSERRDLVAGYARRIFDPDPEVWRPAVAAWAAYEGSIAALAPDPKTQDMFGDPSFALAYSRMNMHYFSHDCFLARAPILGRMKRIARIPAILVHGRYDLATPYRSAVELARRWPAARLVTVADGGHSRYQPALAAALVQAGDDLKPILEPHR